MDCCIVTSKQITYEKGKKKSAAKTAPVESRKEKDQDGL